MATTKSEDGDFGFQIAPMVDVVFVLLLFFMACAGATRTEGLFKIALPSSHSGPLDDLPIIIDINGAGDVFMNGLLQAHGGTDHQLPVLLDYLTREAGNDSPTVVIRPTLDARHERVIDVLNACRKAHIEHLTFG